MGMPPRVGLGGVEEELEGVWDLPTAAAEALPLPPGVGVVMDGGRLGEATEE